jgi:MFS family permease
MAETMAETSWFDLLRRGNASRCAVVGGGMMMHAVSTFIVTTILPSVVQEIGGLRYFAWSTTLYVIASLLGGANCASLLRRVGARNAYRLALALFTLGAVIGALAPSMAVLLLGRFVQGLGAGTMSALSFSMVRMLFAQPLWTRALTIVSLAWGVATLGGPAIGGIFAESGAWRAAFWSLAGLAMAMALLVELSLPKRMIRPEGPALPVSLLSLAILAGSALCISAGSMATEMLLSLAGVALAMTGLALFAWREAHASVRVLPRGSCDPRTTIGGIYGAMLLLLIGVNSEIFIPYFLQHLHAMTPLHAGYVSAMMAGGWSAAALLSSGRAKPLTLLRAGPLVMAAGLLITCVVMPQSDWPNALALPLLAIAMLAMGGGMGMCWPHLGAAVFTNAPDGERDLASTSITSIIMIGNAFGSATGGLVTNLAGMATTPASAAFLLYAIFACAPLAAAFATRRLK